MAGPEPDGAANPALQSARAQLRELVASGGWSSALGRIDQRSAAGRASAVLLLFGPHPSGAVRHAVTGSDAPGHPTPADSVHVLLTRRSDSLRHHPGQVAFPGGGLDPGESPQQAALREAVEECAVSAPDVELIGALPAVPLTFSGNVVTPVIGWEPVPTPLVPDGVETTSAFRVPVAELIDPTNRGVVRLPDTAPNVTRFETPAFAVAGELVWGFTAFVLDALLDALGWTRPWDRQRTLPLP